MVIYNEAPCSVDLERLWSLRWLTTSSNTLGFNFAWSSEDLLPKTSNGFIDITYIEHKCFELRFKANRVLDKMIVDVQCDLLPANRRKYRPPPPVNSSMYTGAQQSITISWVILYFRWNLGNFGHHLIYLSATPNGFPTMKPRQEGGDLLILSARGRNPTVFVGNCLKNHAMSWSKLSKWNWVDQLFRWLF